MNGRMNVSVVQHGDCPGLPSYATHGAAGMDLKAAQVAIIEPGEWAKISTGLFIEVPPGFEAQIRPRSGLAWKSGVTVLNAPGTIDSDYRGEVCVLLINHGPNRAEIHVGDRIAQMVFAPVVQVRLVEVDALSETRRGEGGFGHTGG